LGHARIWRHLPWLRPTGDRIRQKLSFNRPKHPAFPHTAHRSTGLPP
jgi:hypothetical protein